MGAQLTVVPLAQQIRRGPVGVLGVPDGLTWVDASDGNLEAAAIRGIAEHFGLDGAVVQDGTAIAPEAGWPAVLAQAGVSSTNGRGVHVVCVLVLRRQLLDWTVGRKCRDDVVWVPRDHRWGSADDAQAVALAVEAARELLRRTSIATIFVGPVFSLPELRYVYDDLWDTTMDAPNFQRRFTAPSSALLRPMPNVEVANAAEAHQLEGVVVTRTRTSESRVAMAHPPGPGRPPQLWLAGDEVTLEPPLMVPRKAGWRRAVLGPWQFEDLQGGLNQTRASPD